jgi:transposase
MDGILPQCRFTVKERLNKRMRECWDGKMKVRYLIIVNLLSGRSVDATAAALRVARSTVYRVGQRFRDFGEAGLVDGREGNGGLMIDEEYLSVLYEVVRGSPTEHGWRRPTWTREMLVQTMQKEAGITISVSTMSRALKAIRARRGRPRPRVQCPWSKQAKDRRLREIRALVNNLPAGHVAFYEDEVDVHLNPKIGLDWMVRGQQKEVLTPGQNEKRYLAGAMEAKTGKLVWVEYERKSADLFVLLLHRLAKAYPDAKVIHVILDNYRVHHSDMAGVALKALGGRIRLHFLPPYCPDDNKIERLWQDLHAGVTRNHCCRSMKRLMNNVRAFLEEYNAGRESHAGDSRVAA